MALEGFADPWEHVRLLSDAHRNKALLDVLGRHVPGRSVLEVGCGTGLLSLIAARVIVQSFFGFKKRLPLCVYCLYCEVLHEMGFPHAHVDQALLEVFAARNDYAAEASEFIACTDRSTLSRNDFQHLRPPQTEKYWKT